jgi:hypothetical protein
VNGEKYTQELSMALSKDGKLAGHKKGERGTKNEHEFLT